MAHLLDQLINFVSAHPFLAYATAFFAALLEAVPVLGSFVPGSSVIIGLSALVAAGDLSLGGVLAGAIVGAVIGDGTAFLLGNIERRRILTWWPMASYPTLIARSEEFFQRRGTIAVLLARFVPPVRAFVPVTAGALGMPPTRFYPINLVAIGLWACAHVLPGALAGSLWKQHGREIEHIALPLLAVAIAVAVVLWFVRRRHLFGAS
ncbi:DedA family protein [Bradyrhizobium sp. LHD-71]|uniref:DedA family protein n=1 Tax=Bradyrhizobium sp. LHD-71 TaxID=3072141 RepID=UPI00280DB79F|nr:DedA family protein [Bradyrhizobium sp. LHD-71]MDQ8732816.1 DedA family protein [Bradyrhizobium sp. LHD-71]